VEGPGHQARGLRVDENNYEASSGVVLA